ncbi:MAG: 3'-5' exonuclease [Saprospiraceae bacterium]|nr:3'-5' exonuclease [Saprospiraceae bacterium]
MNFNLDRDLCFFDIESTGLNVIRDRIVQIAVIRYFADGRPPEELELLVNPGIPISEDAMAVHGITPADVANKPVFGQVADQLYAFFGNSDLAGYNCYRFDVPLLVEEFARVGYEFDIENRRIIDSQRIFYKMEPRTLKAALKFYKGEKIENAHDAMADVRATVAVLEGQIERYQEEDFEDSDGNVIEKPIRNDMQSIFEFTMDDKMIDVTQRLKFNGQGVVVFNFGKYVGKPVGETLYNDRQYYNWIQDKEFSVQVKKKVTILLEEYKKQLNR